MKQPASIAPYRDADRVVALSRALHAAVDPGRQYHFMEFCGGHTHAIARYGLTELMPANLRMIHGPGCPVCVLPMGRVDNALAIARDPTVIFCTYGDAMRVPGSNKQSLQRAKAEGADVRMVYSPLDALRIAHSEPGRNVVFFAIGFETTAPATAAVVKRAKQGGVHNFFVFCNHVLTPAAISNILESPQLRKMDASVRLDGFVGPAHVSSVIGWKPYEYFCREYQRPVVVAGFEPADIMQAVLMLVDQANGGRAEVENEYRRAVQPDGNEKAKRLVAEVFELRRSFEWRGLGRIPYSGLRLRGAYAAHDVEARWSVPSLVGKENPACECGAILRGLREPADCRLFATVCTPENPMGSCMVSSEGACAAHYRFGRHRADPRRQVSSQASA